MDVVDVARKFELFDETWSPRIVGELNGQQVKLAKFEGEFIWHEHEHEDELFWVVKGEITIHLEDRDLVIGPGQFAIVPKGVRHKPVAKGVAWVMLLEPKTTVNTGEVASERTVEAQWI